MSIYNLSMQLSSTQVDSRRLTTNPFSTPVRELRNAPDARVAARKAEVWTQRAVLGNHGASLATGDSAARRSVVDVVGVRGGVPW